MCVAAAIVGAGAIGAIGSVVAGGEQAGAQTNASNMQQGMFNTINAQESPFRQAGVGATTSLSNLLGTGSGGGAAGGGTDPATGLPNGYLTQQFNPTQSQLENYPGYQFQLQQGGAAVTNSATPGSGALSGSTLKNLMNFNQQTAASNYGTYFNQFQQQQNNIFSRLSGIAGLGQNAASNTGTAGTSLGIGSAQATAAAGGSVAGGIVGATNSIGGAGVPLAYLAANQNSGTSGETYQPSMDPNSGSFVGPPAGG